MMNEEIQLIGKNEFLISTILDCLDSLSIRPKIIIYNNLNLEIENNFSEYEFDISFTREYISSKNSFITLNKKESIQNVIEQCGLNVNSLLTIKHKKSHVDKSTIIGNNCLIGSMVTIAQNSFLDNFVRINRNCSIGHHTILKNNVILNPGVNIAGHVIVQENTTIGMGTNVLNKIKIGKNCVIGAGSLVTKDIPDGVVAYGSPCKIIRENSY